MSDERVREALRRWRASGSVADEAAYLALRARRGELPPGGLEVAAYLGHPAARAAIPEGDEAPEPVGAKAELLELLWGVAAIDPRWVTVAALGLRAPLLEVWGDHGPGDELAPTADALEALVLGGDGAARARLREQVSRARSALDEMVARRRAEFEYLDYDELDAQVRRLNCAEELLGVLSLLGDVVAEADTTERIRLCETCVDQVVYARRGPSGTPRPTARARQEVLGAMRAALLAAALGPPPE